MTAARKTTAGTTKPTIGSGTRNRETESVLMGIDLLDQGDEGRGSDVEATCVVGEGPHRVEQLGRGCGVLGDDGAAPATQVDEAVVAQSLVGAQDGVDVDVERGGELACRGEPVPRPHRSARDLGPHRSRELIEERDARRGVDSEKHTGILLF